MRAILLGPVAEPNREWKGIIASLKITKRDLLVAIDGGAKLWRRFGYDPSFAIGDWDSLSVMDRDRALRGIPRISLRSDKDRSDTYYAMRAALALGADELVCLGVTGGRPDHHLAVMLDLGEIAETRGVKAVQALGPEARYEFLTRQQSPFRLVGQKGQTVSFFALGAPVRGVTLSGFEYGLSRATLKPGSRGLSNRIKGLGRIELRSGRLVVILPQTAPFQC